MTKRWRQHLLIALFALACPLGTEAIGAELALPAALRSLPAGLEWQAARANLQSAAQGLEAARAAAGLRVNAGGDYSSSAQVASGSSSAPAKDSAVANVSVSANLAVLPWSSNFDAVRNAERSFERSKLDWREAKNTLALNLLNQYFGARIAARDLELGKSNVQIIETQFKFAQQQQANGQIAREALQNAERNLENARLNLQQAQNSADLALLTLGNSLNANLEGLSLSTAANELELPKGSLEDLSAQALTRRGDVLKAFSRLKDAEDALFVAQRDRWLPDARLNLGLNQQGGYSVSGGLNFQNGSLSFSAGAPVWQNPSGTTGASNLNFSASLNVPLINPSADAKILSAQQSLESAKASLESSKRAANLDVRQKFLDAGINLQRVTLARAAVQNGGMALETAQKKLQAGLATALDVAQALQNVAQAERDLEQAIINQHLSVRRLEQATGSFNLLEGIE